MGAGEYVAPVRLWPMKAPLVERFSFCERDASVDLDVSDWTGTVEAVGGTGVGVDGIVALTMTGSIGIETVGTAGLAGEASGMAEGFLGMIFSLSISSCNPAAIGGFCGVEGADSGAGALWNTGGTAGA